MTTSNKPENQKTQGSLCDLGQITFEPKRHDGELLCFIRHKQSSWRTIAVGYDTTSKAAALDTYATMVGSQFDLAMELAGITSTSKDSRESAKKEVKRFASIGLEILTEAFRQMREFEAQEAKAMDDEISGAVCFDSEEKYCCKCGLAHSVGYNTLNGPVCMNCIDAELSESYPKDQK